jgi:hypothetical protein
VIRWDPVGFLTLHDTDSSRIYHDRTTPTWFHDVICGFRGIAAGAVKLLAGAARSIPRRRVRTPSKQPYLLLITVGGAKYAGEERAVIESCRARSLAVRVVHTFSGEDAGAAADVLSPSRLLRPWDCLAALANWLGKLCVESRQFWTRDRKRRSLFADAISSMRQYYFHRAFADRVIAAYGCPRAVLSLLPSAPMSRSIVDRMKTAGVPTFGIRTQLVSRHLEHLAINTDVLLCKSIYERREYQVVFGGTGPRLEEGCILSLPESYPGEPLSLPDSYALLLGTAPTTDENETDYGRYNERLFRAAAAAGLPVVFKSHGLGKELDGAWFAEHPEAADGCLRIDDIHRNRELIDRASVVVSAPSTLLYYAILRDVPVVVVESRPYWNRRDELHAAPIVRIPWQDSAALNPLDGNALRESSLAAKRWFEQNYYLDKGPDSILERMLTGAC